MKNIVMYIVTVTTALFSQENITTYVNPFIGTDRHGHVYPGATIPFGMVQLSPDNGTEGWDWTSGYHYSDSTIKGFSHTHFSGTGIGDLCDVLIMPTILVDPKAKYSSKFSHNDEAAEPGYYRVKLQSTNILAELTTTDRAGFHRYTFPKSINSKIIIDLGHRLNWDSPTVTNLNIISPTLITGFRFSKGWAPNQRIYFAARISKNPKNIYLGNDSSLVGKKRSVTEKGSKAVIEFSTKKDEQILVKVGISGVSIDGALKNLDSEIPRWNFDSVKIAAHTAWEKELSKIIITTADQDHKTVFYTSLYRTMLAPIIYNDVDGRYRGGNDSVCNGKNFTNYTTFSLWDTYRASHPLFTILQPKRVNDFINSMLAFKREYGYLPVWNFHANETMCMIGYHSIPVIVDAYLKGFRGFDAEEAFSAMKQSATSDRMGLKWYRQYEYIPSDLEVESVSKTLEYCYDDWCIAQMAKALGKESDEKEFLHRSTFFRNLFDSSSLFMRGKLSTGEWRSLFDPLSVNHRMDDYTEGNAWQYSWYVPHDIAGLINMIGSKEKFIQRLDSLFEQKTTLQGENTSPDITGLIGQYAHGNEPSHHIAYLYNYAGAPSKTQEQVSAIMNSMYKNSPDGLSGNDDCGQMSAWYIFSSLGFYPVNPAEQVYVFGTPSFERTLIILDDNKVFTIEAMNVSDKNRYIQSVLLNGKPVERSYIYHSEIMNGGTLVFEMTDHPTQWGSVESYFPPSMSK
jgi:predicted alpha-1,2-mannosidase